MTIIGSPKFRSISRTAIPALAIMISLAGCGKLKRKEFPHVGPAPRAKKRAQFLKRERLKREKIKREMAKKGEVPGGRPPVEYAEEAVITIDEYKPPKIKVPAPSGEIVNVGVLDMESVGCDESIGLAVSDAVGETLFSSGHYQVMDRSDMDKVLLEQDFQQSGRCDDMECIVKVGKILAVEKIVAGKVALLGSTYRITLKLVDVESAKVDKIASESCTCPKDQLFLVAETAAKRLLLP